MALGLRESSRFQPRRVPCRLRTYDVRAYPLMLIGARCAILSPCVHWEVQSLTGPAGIAVVDAPEPEADPAGASVIVDMVCGGVSFPDLLQSQGLYQYRPDPPFRPGIEAAGVVRSAPTDSGLCGR